MIQTMFSLQEEVEHAERHQAEGNKELKHKTDDNKVDGEQQDEAGEITSEQINHVLLCKAEDHNISGGGRHQSCGRITNLNPMMDYMCTFCSNLYNECRGNMQEHNVYQACICGGIMAIHPCCGTICYESTS